MPSTPLYAFGEGLSYTEFEYSGFKTQLFEDRLDISFDITNTGSFVFEPGRFIVQIGKACNNICFEAEEHIDFK